MRRDLTAIDLAALLSPPNWMRDALCLEYHDVEFFTERGKDPRPAKVVCSRCTVRDDCLAYALEHRIDYGIWGGMSAHERAKLRSE
jgi:WhiB family redox-sensing transcriptional regulator